MCHYFPFTDGELWLRDQSQKMYTVEEMDNMEEKGTRTIRELEHHPYEESIGDFLV